MQRDLRPPVLLLLLSLGLVWPLSPASWSGDTDRASASGRFARGTRTPPGGVPIPSAKKVQALEDFKTFTEAHRARVQVLGLMIRDAYPDLFSDVPPDLLRSYLAIHDLPKLGKYLEPLFAQYGKNLAGSEKSEFLQQVVSPLNADEEGLKQDFFRQQGYLNADGKVRPESARLVELLKKIEMIADLVDRGEDPVAAEEFGVPMKAAAEFLQIQADRIRSDDPARASFLESCIPISKWLATHYETMVADLTFEAYVRRSCLLTLAPPPPRRPRTEPPAPAPPEKEAP